MSVKPIVGIALIALGFIAFVYYTTRGSDLASPWAPILGVLALAGGIVVLLAGKKGIRLLASSR